MSKRRRWHLVFGLFAIAVVVIVGAYILKFGPQSGWRSSPDPEDWARLGEYVGGVFGVLAFIGVLITMSLQRDQLDEQMKTSRRQLRAYVFVQESTVNGLKINGQPEVHIVFKNFGQTPAYNITWAIGIDIARTFESRPSATEQWSQAGSLGPGATFVFKSLASPALPVLTEEQFGSLNDGTLTLFVYGTVRFEDAFGNKNRFLKFRVMTLGKLALNKGQLFSCTEGNETDRPD